VNDIPGDNAASVFNAHWGQRLSIGAEGCFAIFLQPSLDPKPPDGMSCGPLTDVGIPPNGYVVVGRGGAAAWLFERVGMPIAAGFTSPIPNLEFAVGGSHLLVQAGTPTALPSDRSHPRSMIGVDAGGFLYLVAVEGYGEDVGGMTLHGLQEYAVALGLVNAINLDGGGSTGMYMGGRLVNYPSDGRERLVPSLVEAGLPVKPCNHAFIRCY
jgi:hypothetical protein